MICRFAVEKLEWEFEYEIVSRWRDISIRQLVEISDSGHKIKKKLEYMGIRNCALMRLYHWKFHKEFYDETKPEQKYTMKVKVQSELQNDTWVEIGIMKDWRKERGVNYQHTGGQIVDNNQEIKKIDRKLIKGSIIEFTNEMIKQTNNTNKMYINEKIFKVSVMIDGVMKCISYYRDTQQMIPYLFFGENCEVELDVELISKIWLHFLRS